MRNLFRTIILVCVFACLAGCLYARAEAPSKAPASAQVRTPSGEHHSPAPSRQIPSTPMDKNHLVGTCTAEAPASEEIAAPARYNCHVDATQHFSFSCTVAPASGSVPFPRFMQNTKYASGALTWDAAGGGTVSAPCDDLGANYNYNSMK